MIATQNISLSYSGKPLFKNVNIKFTAGNCYGIIGANGTGKSTFLKVLSGELEPTTGEVVITPGERMAVLRQNHFEFDSYEVLQTVIMGHKRLYEIMKEKDELYAKEDFTDADGERASELEGEFAELDGWSAESNAETILTGLGISLDLEHKLMSELDGSQKVKVLLAQALFGNPDILLLDDPTNYLDIQSVRWLENFLLDFPNTVIVVSHDRHFLNKVCTHICDIDFGKIQMYVGNYDFWYEYTQMVARTTLFQILMGEMEPDEGSFKWGVTTSRSYFPKDNGKYFDNCEYNLIDWLRQFSQSQYESDIRGWLGRMLFSGEEALKPARVLSGGEKVRCMLARTMLSGANVLILDEPTNHLDLESITALNKGMIEFTGSMLFATQDHECIQTVANRIMEILPGGLVDRRESYDDYIESEIAAQQRAALMQA